MKRSATWLMVFAGVCCGCVANAALPAIWNVRTSGVANRLNTVAYGGGLFVAVAPANQVLVSHEGINWSAASVPATNGQFYCAAYGAGRYVLGGNLDAFVRCSTDAIHWTNGVSGAIGTALHGLVYAYGRFVAVGSNAQSQAYILTSSNGLDWAYQTLPASSPLLAVCAAGTSNSPLYIAVGDGGTILGSTNGTDWTARYSGTAVRLSAAVWFQGQFIVAGDSGISLTSSDGISWGLTAPPSFTVENFASSAADGAVVAAGYFMGWGGAGYAGRLQASADGLSWPGSALEFSSGLHGVAYGGNSFVAVGDNGLILQSVLGPLSVTNEWTKATSGYWEEMNWALGVLPAAEQQAVAIRNPGWKAVAIGADTTAQYPDALTVNDLIVDAPLDSGNQLLLNWAGLNTPLVIRSNLVIGTRGSLASHYSALQAAKGLITGPASFSDYATEDFNELWLALGATVGLTNGTMTCSNLIFFTANFTQSGGTLQVQKFSNRLGDFSNPFTYADYYLQDGMLLSQDVNLGSGGGHGPEGHAFFQQTGGIHTNQNMWLWGWEHYGSDIPLGTYELDAGLLVSSSVTIEAGYFSQCGGTNLIQELDQTDGGFYLRGGQLVTSNVSVGVDPIVLPLGFYQTGGVHTVQGQLLLTGGWPYRDFRKATYQLAGGTLSTANIEIQGGALRLLSEGTVSNAGILTLSGGDLVANNSSAAQYLGQLQVAGGNLDVHDLYGPVQIPTVWHFADSRTQPWTTPVRIWNWGALPGDHIYFGTNAQSLTAAQLAQVQFMINGPNGPTNTPGLLLASGELVPATPPRLGFANPGRALVLSWAGGYDLVSATNVLGPYNALPGAMSPWTNHFTETQRYFRLRLPTP